MSFACIALIKASLCCPGMVELVPSSDTLRKIQVEYGVTGSFKDKPLAEWLRKYNPAEDEYDKVHTWRICFVIKMKGDYPWATHSGFWGDVKNVIPFFRIMWGQILDAEIVAK